MRSVHYKHRIYSAILVIFLILMTGLYYSPSTNHKKSNDSLNEGDPNFDETVKPESAVNQTTKSNQQPVTKQTVRFYSQSGQDKWLEPHIKKENGVYVEFGAQDGIQGSNTAYFALKYNWTGVLVEPDTRFYYTIKNKRPEAKAYTGVVVCPVGLDKVDFAVSKIRGWSGILSNYISPKWNAQVQQVTKSVKCVDLNDICPEVVDFMSMDTEGSEFSILKTFNFETHNVRFIMVENQRDTEKGIESEKLMTDFMAQKGYDKIHELPVGLDLTNSETTTFDNVYRRRSHE